MSNREGGRKKKCLKGGSVNWVLAIRCASTVGEVHHERFVHIPSISRMMGS